MTVARGGSCPPADVFVGEVRGERRLEGLVISEEERQKFGEPDRPAPP
jgi:hypothetical protein